MKRSVFLICIILLFSATIKAQEEKPKTYIDMAMIYEGDTVPIYALRPVHIFAPLKFRSNKERQEYSKLVRDVKKTYPYARMIASSIIETYEYMGTFSTEKEKQKYLEDVQKYMMAEYKPQMKKMTKSQGRILIKLIDRECNTASYNIVKALVGSFKAGIYNAFASLFGNSLKAEYDPHGKDAAIEAIVLQIEDGTVDYYYSVNYHSFK